MTIALLEIEKRGVPTWVAVKSSNAARGMTATKVVIVNNPSLQDIDIILETLNTDGRVYHIDILTE